MATLDGNITMPTAPTPTGNTWRGLGGDWFGQNQIAKEDFNRQIQQQQYGAQITAALNKQLHNNQRELRQTQYQDIVKSARAAGINPVFALGAANFGSSPAGSSSSPGSNYQGGTASTGNFLQMLTSIVSGLITSNAMLSAAAMKGATPLFQGTGAKIQNSIMSAKMSDINKYLR